MRILTLLFLSLVSLISYGTDTGWLSPSTTGTVYNQWTENPTYAYTNDNQSANCSCLGGYNKIQDYGGWHTGITGSVTIQGIELFIEGHAQTGYPGSIYVKISGDGGVSWTAEKQAYFTSSNDAIVMLGTSSDVWGGTWTSSSFSDANFLIAYRTVDGGGCPYKIGMDYTQVKIHYTAQTTSIKNRKSSYPIWFLTTYSNIYEPYTPPPVTSSLHWGYTSNYTLAVKEKFAIPENVVNGDWVGQFIKTWTWQPIGTISFSLEQNWHNAFSVNASGLISISDASKINGKIVRQDTVINVLIRTTDGSYSEVDTAQIWVKENASCVFIDYSGSNGAGTRASPYNTFPTLATGKMYCIKRGNIAYNKKTAIHSLISNVDHPIIFTAWGSGNKPCFSGADDICFNAEINTGQSNTTFRDEYVYFYEIKIRNGDYPAFKANRFCDHFGWYNCEFYNNDKVDIESTMMLLTDSEDTLRSFDFEISGCIFDTTSYYLRSGSGGSIDSRHFSDPSQWKVEPSFIKMGVAATITNTYFGNTPGSGVRFGYGIGSTMPRKYMSHCLINNTWPTGAVNGYGVGIQIRTDNYTVLDCKILGPFNIAIILSAAGGSQYYECQPDNVHLDNVYISGQSMYGVYLADNGTGYKPFHNTILENSYIYNVPTGLKEVKGVNTIVRRSVFAGGSGNAIVSSNSSVNFTAYYNDFYGWGGTTISFPVGTNPKIYNCMVDGNISFSATGAEVKNCFYGAITGTGTFTQNIYLSPTVKSTYFVNFSAKNFTLTSAATEAIDKGANLGLSPDISGTPVPNNITDIGSKEY
jgi:hypothetical protein